MLPQLLVVIIGLLIGPVLVEVAGYVWHRYAEHKGIMGEIVRHKHIVHHEVLYPIDDLRHGEHYEDAHSWTWYAVGGLGTALFLYFIPLQLSVPITIGGWAYGMFLEFCHRAYHLPKHVLHRFKWYKTLERRHDIHHYGPYNYGILVFFMDRIFGTLRDDFPEKKIDGFPGLPKHLLR